MFKNVAAKFVVFAFDATTNVPKTGDAANITAYVSKDYGTVTVLADTSGTEMDATNAPGYYLFDAAQGETNADILLISAKSSTSNIKVIGAPAVVYTRPTTGWLAPTVAARTLDVSAGGEAGLDWANVGSPTTSLALTGTSIAVTQKVDVDTIKTNPVVNGGTITFPTNKTLADTTSAVGSVTGNVGGNVTGSVGSVAGAVASVTGLTASDVGAIKAKTDNLPASPAAVGSAMALTSGERDSVADAMLNRDMSTGADSGSTTVRTVRQALRFLRNKWSISGTTLTVTKEDDSTSSWSSELGTTPGADPVTSSDPAG